MMKRALCCLVAIILVVCLSSAVLAKDEYYSPSGEDFWEITINTSGGGYADADPMPVRKGEAVTFDAHPYDGFIFSFWTIEGDFEWVENDANSAHMVIRPFGPIKAYANFVGKGAEKDVSPVSPKTGIDTDVAMIVMSVVVTASAAAVIYTGKKYFAK